nr:histone deacetylase 14 [Tanacetum cinerariifolium]
MADVNAPSGHTPTMDPPRKHMFHPKPDSAFHLVNDEPVLGYLKFSAKGTKREVFEMPIPGRLITVDIREASYYQEYQVNVAKHRGFLAEAEDAPAEERQVADEDADYQKTVEESMKDAYALPKGPLPPVVIREPESGKYQPLPEVPGKGKAKRFSEPTRSSGHDESPYALLGQSDDKEESEKVVLEAEEGGQDEGQAGPDPGDAEAKGQSILSPVVHAGSDREHMDLDVADVSPQPSMEQLDEGFTAMVYPNVQENLKLTVEEPVLLEEPSSLSGTLSSLQHLSRDFSFGDQFFSDKHSDADKNAETEVESMVNVMIQQALSSIPLMTSPIIDLTSRPESSKEHHKQKHRGEVGQTWGASVYTTTIGHLSIEILHQRMWESDSYKSHEVHMQLFEALKKSMNRDHSEELAQDLAEARKKKKKRRESPKTSPGSPSYQPPPPPLPAGPSGASGAPKACGSAQMPPTP